ncbi:MAG TPA: Grx4 family monothiol glutaredoxin [Candidatus Thiothrix moscowensis]|uniref:Grx4 family monothiol glutaredoxin n=1 Tax=unclassified Thiothrix TaxID=2636184 RepID=UPI0025ED5A8E|nr:MULTISPECIES: Grx4 family monothiol glutaredoxin [unclassified Thiothrix]HRJ54541.1 Grx4 family monothiol glutaredoxin [Candidatus Thiothrix moscowensis]HRJ94891.1 Grx4 family monothiol glutaredoxin [Candidatus Thiothrix moscowensis]
MSNKTLEKIQQQVTENPVIIYMKGTPDAPECGLSGKAVSYLKKSGAEFAYVNVLKSPFIYEYLPRFSRFPTFPQVYIGSELVGGSDIVEELYNSGELQTLLAALVEQGKLPALKPPSVSATTSPPSSPLVQLTLP